MSGIDREEEYIWKGARRLRRGYTTGSCAAAAAKAAAAFLLTGQCPGEVKLVTPKGLTLRLAILDARMEDGAAGCAVKKDAGDDPDVTDGILVYAKVRRDPEGEKGSVRICGGEGVGRVTRPGMSVPVGQAAINPVPETMIREAVLDVLRALDETGALLVEISVPGGEKIAARTFNPRLGVEGGISILGTSGIVEPMSEDALKESIRLEIAMLRAAGHDLLLVTPGNYGETFARDSLGLDLSAGFRCSNFVGDTVDMAVAAGASGLLFVAHAGKFIKVAGGIMNTHSAQADCRAELMAAFALRAGADAETARRILETALTDEAVAILREAGLCTEAMTLAAESAARCLRRRAGENMAAEVVLFSNQFGVLGMSEGAAGMMRAFAKNGAGGEE